MHTYVFGLLCLALSCSPQASAESQAAAEMEFAAEQVLEQADALFRKMPAEDQLVSHLLKLSELFSKTKQPCLLYTSPSPRDRTRSRMPSSA